MNINKDLSLEAQAEILGRIYRVLSDLGRKVGGAGTCDINMFCISPMHQIALMYRNAKAAHKITPFIDNILLSLYGHLHDLDAIFSSTNASKHSFYLLKGYNLGSSDIYKKHKIQPLRKKLGISTADFADQLHCDEEEVARYEVGACIPDHQMMERMAQVLNCSTDDLIPEPIINGTY